MMRRRFRSSCGSLFSFTQTRLMRFSSPPPPPPSALKNDKINTSEESMAQQQQPIAILSDITKPVKLPDDYVPYPLPKYDRRSGSIEPLPFDSKTNNTSNESTTRTYEGERTQMKLQQQMQTKSSFAARPTFFGEEFDPIRRSGDGDDDDDRSNEVERDALAVAEEILSRRKQQLQQVALSSQVGGGVEDDDALYATPQDNQSQEKESLGKYTRQPSENGNILDRPICLRPMQELVEQLTHPFPNFERNMAALNDITSKFEDFLQVVNTYGTSDTQAALQVEHESLLRTLLSSSTTTTPKNTHDTKESVADVDVDSILKLKKIYQHRSESHASILNDYLHVSKNLRDMFVGSSLALNLRLFRQGQVIIPTFQNDSTAQQSFWKYFAETESLMVRFVLPELVEILSNNNIRVSDNGNDQQQRLALLLECLTEHLNIIAHFQLLDHARHMTNHHLMPSGKLDRYGSGGRYSWSHATGAVFLDELTSFLSASNNLRSMRQSGHKNRFLSEEEEIAQQMTQDGENENELATSSKFAAIGALPTKTLSEWFVFFSSSYIRDGEHQKLTKNVDLTQELATELILHRLGPACKIAFGLTNGQDSSALFLDTKFNNNENEELLLLLGVESGAERSKIVSDILFACSLSNVTLPADFLQEALLNGALVASEQNPEKIIISSPNFFVAMAKLFGGGNSCFPAEQLFRLAELEIKKFRKQLDAAAENDGNSNLLMSLHNTEHDWISAIYELAFACHDRSAAITFLEDQINFKEESILKHAMRFADPNGKIFADFNLKEAGSYDNDSGALIGREHSNNNNNIVAETCRIRQSAGASGSPLAVGMSAGNSELFRDVDPSYSSSESHSFFPSSLQELTENTQTILQSSVFPSHTKKSNAALAEFLSGSNGKVGGGDDFTVANRRVAAARSCFVLHHTIVKENNFDGLREAIDQCHDNHAVLIVPSTVLWQLTSFTADSSSRSGRLHFEVMKKKIVCALFEEFMEGRAFLISPAEEVLIRYHEGHADADTLVWEACSFLQARAPTTAFFVLADEGSRCANHIALFSRQTTSTSILTEEQKSRGGGGGRSTKNLIPHPLTKHLQPEMLNNQMRRDQIGAIDWQNPMLGERVAGVLWSPDTVRGFDSNFRGAMAARIRDPIGKKSMPGLFMANSRGDRYSFQDMRNYQDKVDSCRGKKIRRVMKGHSFNAVYDDLNDLGIYTPDHV